jgi:ESS family glutamate:Na+ symporter
VLTLDQIQTVALAGLLLFVGHGIRRLIPILSTYNIPAPVVGGLLMAAFITVSRANGWTPLTFTPTLQSPMMVAFFTTIGFGASLALLRVGGPAVLLFFVLSTIMAVMQNVIGVGAAYALGQHPLMGVLAGSVTLTGGPATGLAFAPLFESAGVPGAATLAVAAAMIGIVSGGVVGGPVATRLLSRLGRQPLVAVKPRSAHALAEEVVERELREKPASAPAGEDVEAYGLLKGLVLILVAMWAGTGQQLVRLARRDVSGLYRRDARRRAHPELRRCDEVHRHVSEDHRRPRRDGPVAVPRHGADVAEAVGSRGRRGAARDHGLPAGGRDHHRVGHRRLLADGQGL